MLRPALVLLAVVCIGVAAAPGAPRRGDQDAKPAEQAAEFKIPEEEIKRENPVKSTGDSVAAGKRIWGTDCAFCHGADGDGKGDLVEPMGLKVLDYRDAKSLEKFTDGELHYIILKGKGKMPGGEARLKGDRAWHLVNYVRSLAKKEAPAKSGS